ncbi:AAA family ATPase [Aeromonas enteropelogenes]|uniref:AAA family ATPase n=1 Tax=Aeromonas enteropelogenes TaxID=29489 RepID=UPI003B9DF57F
MITHFTGENYKAFKNFDLEIKPITVLLGANSCGKSALINALLMLSQTADSVFVSESALRLNGNKIGMGEALNVVRDKNSENELGFSFSFSIDEIKTLKSSLDSLRRDAIEAHFSITRVVGQIFRANKIINPSFLSAQSELDTLFFSAERYNSGQLKKIATLTCNTLKLYRKQIENIKRKTTTLSVDDFLNKSSFTKINDCFSTLSTLTVGALTPQKISYKFKYSKKIESLVITSFSCLNRGGDVIFEVFRENKTINLKSDIIEKKTLKNSKKDILELLNLDTFSIVKPEVSLSVSPFHFFEKTKNPFASLIAKMMHATTAHLIDSISDLNINHVSPLRAFPQRYYLLDKSMQHTKLNALDGTELAEILKKNPQIKHNINLLLAPFNIAVDVERVNDIIHKIIVNQDAVDLELTDVGFGISQVLPILVQAYLSPKNSITIIEQPEIHLHPKMQAWLTDALINIALEGNKKFLIETHSDAFVRRIRLRIVDQSCELSEEDVGIYHLERDRIDNTSILKRIVITSDGDVKWPSEFMDVEINDTLLIQKLKLEKYMNDSNGVH